MAKRSLGRWSAACVGPSGRCYARSLAVTRKSISTNAAVVSCDVCGRTLLRGETANVFLHGGARRMVCELCTARAVHEGWIREGLDDVFGRQRDQRGGRPRSLLGRLRARREQERPRGRDADDPAETSVVPEPSYVEVLPPAGREPEPDPEPEPELEPEYVEPPEAPEPVPPPAAPPAQPAPSAPADGGLYEGRSVRGVPTNAELKVARAIEVFNTSAHPRTVAGVARSLGAPIVSARPSATEGSVVTIVVAWELSWYRYEVDLGNEAAGVRVVAQGSELGELDVADQAPNAAADDAGQLHPAASLA